MWFKNEENRMMVTYLDAGNKRDRSMVIDITYLPDFWSGI
jgi:hypothetical protein